MEAIALLEALAAAGKLTAEVISLIDRLKRGDSITQEEIEAATSEYVNGSNNLQNEK